MRVAHAAPHLEGVCWGLVVREDSRVGVHMGILYVLDVPDIFMYSNILVALKTTLLEENTHQMLVDFSSGV